MKKQLLLFLLPLFYWSCLQEAPFKLPYKGFEPIDNGDGWQLSTVEQENVNRTLLNQAFQLLYQDERFYMARSLLIFRNNKLVAEAYPHDLDDINTPYNIQSCTKSITSLLTGIAIQNNKIDSLGELLYNIYPSLFDNDTQKRSITLKDALLMQTGLEFDNGIHTQTLYETTENSTAFVLQQPLVYNAGTVTNYNDGAPHLVSKAIETKVGKTLSAYAKEQLFDPLGIVDWQWEAAKDETTFGAFSLFLKPRDFGKIGQLLLQNGVWNTQQMIDHNYLAAATSIQTSANFNSEPYGYYFWILPAANAYLASGHGGQFLLVAPAKNLVVVYTAFPYTNKQLWDERNELIDLILKSCD